MCIIVVSMAFNDRNMYRNVATHGDTAVCLEGLVEGIEDRLRLWCERGQARRRSRRLRTLEALAVVSRLPSSGPLLLAIGKPGVAAVFEA